MSQFAFLTSTFFRMFRTKYRPQKLLNQFLCSNQANRIIALFFSNLFAIFSVNGHVFGGNSICFIFWGGRDGPRWDLLVRFPPRLPRLVFGTSSSAQPFPSSSTLTHASLPYIRRTIRHLIYLPIFFSFPICCWSNSHPVLVSTT